MPEWASLPSSQMDEQAQAKLGRALSEEEHARLFSIIESDLNDAISAVVDNRLDKLKDELEPVKE